MKKLIPLIILIAAAALIISRVGGSGLGGSRNSVAGIPAPIQQNAQGEVTKQVDDYNVTINYKASYQIEALVVHTQNYNGSSIADKLAPKDLALAWGTVAQHNEDIDFHWNQSTRWYYWHVNSYEELAPVGTETDVNTQSANNHIIASDDTVAKLVKSIKTGDHIRLTGYLVDVKAEKPDGTYYTWNSSTSRNDTGNGSCEVVYVNKVEFLN